MDALHTCTFCLHTHVFSVTHMHTYFPVQSRPNVSCRCQDASPLNSTAGVSLCTANPERRSTDSVTVPHGPLIVSFPESPMFYMSRINPGSHCAFLLWSQHKHLLLPPLHLPAWTLLNNQDQCVQHSGLCFLTIRPRPDVVTKNTVCIRTV